MPDLYHYLLNLGLGPEVHVLAALVSKGGRRPLVKVVVDTPAGVTIDEIAGISRMLRKDTGVVREVGTADFRLEVTSPGAKAGLTEPWQFPRHLGRRLVIELSDSPASDEGRTSIEGELIRTSPEGIVLRLAEGEEEIAWKRIQQAVVQLDW